MQARKSISHRVIYMYIFVKSELSIPVIDRTEMDNSVYLELNLGRSQVDITHVIKRLTIR